MSEIDEGSDIYMAIKLITGEQVLATVTYYDKKIVDLYQPLVISTIMSMGEDGTEENFGASPLCRYTDDEYFTIEMKNILFIKPMSDIFIDHYLRLLNEVSEDTSDIDQENVFIVSGSDTLN